MKVPIMSVLDRFRRSSFFLFVVLLAVCAALIPPTPLKAAVQEKTGKAKEKTLKEILEELRVKKNPPMVVADPNANTNIGIMFRWGLPEYEMGDARSLTLAPQQSLGGRANPFDGSRAFDGVDPFNRETRFKPETRFSSPSALNRSNVLGQSQALERKNPFGASQRFSGSPFGNASMFGASRARTSSETFGSRHAFGLGRGGGYGSARGYRSNEPFGTSRPFATSSPAIRASRFGESTRARRFDTSSGTGQSSRLYGNPGSSYKGLSNRANAFNRLSPFGSTGSSNGSASPSAPMVFGGR